MRSVNENQSLRLENIADVLDVDVPGDTFVNLAFVAYVSES